MSARSAEPTEAPDGTAVRVALWRAMHLDVDPPPHVLDDGLGLRLVAPPDGWRRRPDMDQHATRRNRASILARARYVEDLVAEQVGVGVGQYLLLGAGLDTFAQRRPDIASRLTIFEVDRPGAQAWKRRRLIELGLGVPDGLRFVPIDFEAGGDWWATILAAGFDPRRPAVVASTGVAMYLTREAVLATLRPIAALATGSTLVMTFMIPLHQVLPEERPQRQAAENGARAAGTPMISFFTPSEMMAVAREAGFREPRHLSPAELTQRYFSARSDGLRPSSSEHLVVAMT